MPLSLEDIQRISRLGYSPDFFVVRQAGDIPRLRNINGHCVFLDVKTGMCKIYQYRPIGCRFYPLIYDECSGVTVDHLCPRAGEISREEIERLAPLLIMYLKLLEEEYGVKLL